MIVSNIQEKLQEQVLSAVEFLLEEINPFVIYIFGSASRNELRDDSDIDIAYLSDKEIDDYDNFMLAQELYDIFKRDVDLINLKKSSTVFKAQVVGYGKVIYCNDNIRREYFEMRSFKEYALLNEERECILKRIKETGSIYGK